MKEAILFSILLPLNQSLSLNIEMFLPFQH